MSGTARNTVFMAVGGFAKAFASLLNFTFVYNADTLIHSKPHVHLGRFFSLGLNFHPPIINSLVGVLKTPASKI